MLFRSLRSLEATTKNADKFKVAKSARKHLKAKQKKRRHQPFDPNNLPFRVPTGKVRKPATSKEQFKELGLIQERPIQLASAELTPLMLAQATTDLPQPEHLQPTEDVQITQAIIDKAAELNNHPVEIYNWVHNNIEFLPTYGSIQGSDMTLLTRRGNAFDTSSLLIALLRAANIPARYVYGTVEIPIDQVMNWVGGVEKPEAALQLLGQGGIPSTGLISGGQFKAVQLEHVWVEAWVDFIPSRGAKNIQGDTWVPMDGSFKQYDYSPGPDTTGQAFQDVLDRLEIVSQTTTVNKQEGWIQGVDTNLFRSMLTFADSAIIDALAQPEQSLRSAAVVGRYVLLLSSGLPYKVVSTAGTTAVLADSLRMRFWFRLYASETDRVLENPLIQYEVDLVNLGTKQFRLTFQPASQADLDLIRSYLPVVPPGEQPALSDLPDALPGYLIQLKAQLKLDETVLSEGGVFSLGDELSSYTAVSRLTGGRAEAVNHPIAGETHLVRVDLQGIPNSELLGSLNNQVGNVLPSIARSYFAHLDTYLDTLFQTGQAIAYRHPSFASFSTSLTPRYSFGIAIQVDITGLRVDADVVTGALVTPDGDSARAAEVRAAAGILLSAMEHEIPEIQASNSQYPADTVSAVKALATAMDQGQRLYTVTAANRTTVLPALAVGVDVKSDIIVAVNAGLEVFISQTEVTIGPWRGIGYIISDPQTGAGVYRISGGLNGGESRAEFNKALALAGLGALAGYVVPDAYASVLDCDDVGRRNQRIPWADLLFWSMVLILILTRRAPSLPKPQPAPVPAPAPALAFVKAYAALTTLFLQINAAKASNEGMDCPTYVSGPQTSRGTPMTEITDHISSALSGGAPSTLTWLGWRVGWNIHRGDDSFSKGWYNNTDDCSPDARKAFQDANGPADCDEYPFFSTGEGGPINYFGNPGAVSLQFVQRSHNRAQGGTLSAFYLKCKVERNQRYRVDTVTNTGSITHGLMANGTPCYP